MKLRVNAKKYVEANDPNHGWLGTSSDLTTEELVEAKKAGTLGYFTKTFFGEKGSNRLYVSLELINNDDPFAGL